MSRMAQAIQEEVEKMRARRWGTKRRTPAMTDETQDGATEIAPEPEPAAEAQTTETTDGAEGTGEGQMAKTKTTRTKKAAATKTAKAAKTAKRMKKTDGVAAAATNGRGKLWDPNKLPKAKDLVLTGVDGNGNQYLNFRFEDGTVVRAGLQGVGRKATAAKARDIVVEVLSSRLGL